MLPWLQTGKPALKDEMDAKKCSLPGLDQPISDTALAQSCVLLTTDVSSGSKQGPYPYQTEKCEICPKSVWLFCSLCFAKYRKDIPT